MAKSVLTALLAFVCCNCFADEAAWEDISAGNTDLVAVICVPGTSVVCAVTAQGSVIKSGDSGKEWHTVSFVEHSVGTTAARPNLAFDPSTQRLYLCAGTSAYDSSDTGSSWQRVLKKSEGCNAAQATPAGIFIAAGSGLFLSKDGRAWDRIKEMSGKNVRQLAYSAKTQCLFSVTDDGIYAVRPGCGVWQKIFAGQRTPEAAAVTDQQEQDSLSDGESPRLICVDTQSTLYAVFGNRFIATDDCGKSWKNIPSSGLRMSGVSDIACDGNGLIAASGSSVSRLENDSWADVAPGLSGGKVIALSTNGKGKLFAACKRGLFRLGSISGPAETVASPVVDDFPQVRQLQEAAIAYAEVGNAKIQEWRAACRKKAWLPQVSVGVNRDVGDLWHWESGSTTKEGDDTLCKGKDAVTWDAKLTWDLSELVWNNDQTSIDSRAKLMVELRNDILDQVTKLYFERERLMDELSDPSADSRKRRQKELRVRELEAGLDALTGGYFSLSKRGKQ